MLEKSSNDPAAEVEASERAEGSSRRTFVRTGVSLVGALYASAVGYPIYRYVATPSQRAAALGSVTEVTLPGADELEAGSAMMFKFGYKPTMLIHHTDDTWVCFDAVCTHLGCTVRFEPEQQRIYCACHGGVYDMRTGSNVAGPPPKPLRTYTVEFGDGQVIVSRA